MRVQLAVVKNAAGSMDRLLAWLYEGRKDWRDVLVAAEYPRQAAYGPGQAPAEIIAADLAAGRVVKRPHVRSDWLTAR